MSNASLNFMLPGFRTLLKTNNQAIYSLMAGDSCARGAIGIA